jgi:hypothetical protein
MWIDSDYGYYGRCVCLSHDAATRGWVRVGIELAPRQSYRVCIGMSFLSVCCGIGACASLARGREAGKAHTPLEQHWQIPGTALYTKRRSEPRPHPCVRHRPNPMVWGIRRSDGKGPRV